MKGLRRKLGSPAACLASENDQAGHDDPYPTFGSDYVLTSFVLSSNVTASAMAMRITFWGVRGSIPTPGPATVQVGGNTSCVEVRAGKALIILDGGTGLRLLGQKLLKEMPFTAHIFFSHVHWDHIQGFPFFAPAFAGGNTIHLYGGNSVARTLEETLAGQMDYPSFPVQLSQMASTMKFTDLEEGQSLEIDAGDGKLTVTTARGNHPNGVWAYRLEYGGKSMVYATDTEHYSVVDPKLCELASNTDVLIYDSQYTPEEYAGTAGTGGSKVGWGHSTIEEAAKLATAAKAKKLVLFHHDPLQSDAAVEDKERRTREWFQNSVAAYEGLSLDV